MSDRLPYGIEPAPPDLRRPLASHKTIALILLVGALALAVTWAFTSDNPPPSERPSDTFYGLSEGV